MRNKKRFVTTWILFTFVWLLGFQNCFQMKNAGSLESSSTSGDVPLAIERVECKFISVETFRNILRTNLSLPSGDTAILGANGQPTTNRYIATYSVALGAPTPDTPSDPTCTSLKYKLSSEIMINACQEAPATALQALFPQGTADFSALYLTFVGRLPTAEEVQVLQDLVSSVSGTVAQKAACAAVGASVEALARN